MSLNTINRELKARLPAGVYENVRRLGREYREWRYFQQKRTRIRCGDFWLECPENHPLPALFTAQPDRDLCVGIAAKFVGQKYPQGTMLDIGANIGDTAAIIASHTQNPLVLVEASDYFFSFLERNAAQLPNVRKLHKALVSDGSTVAGDFGHWGGTASFREGATGRVTTSTRRLSELGDDSTCFVKSDTDGYDFKILRHALDWLGRVTPAILFEDQIRTEQDLEDANGLLEELARRGYTQFVVWDDPGTHLLSTTSLEPLFDLHRYLLNVSRRPWQRAIANYDVLCLHERDSDLFAAISGWWRARGSSESR